MSNLNSWKIVLKNKIIIYISGKKKSCHEPHLYQRWITGSIHSPPSISEMIAEYFYVLSYLSLWPLKFGPQTDAPATPDIPWIPLKECDPTASCQTHYWVVWVERVLGSIPPHEHPSHKLRASWLWRWRPWAYCEVKDHWDSGCSSGPPGVYPGLGPWRGGYTELLPNGEGSYGGPEAWGILGTKCQGASRWRCPGRMK